MTSRFMTDPHAMRDMAGRFEVHAQTVEDEARRMWASRCYVWLCGCVGERVAVDSVRGAAEDHQLRWGGRPGGCVGQLAESQ